MLYSYTLAKPKVAAAEREAREREDEKERGQKLEKDAKIVFLCPMYQWLDHAFSSFRSKNTYITYGYV